MSIFSKLRPAPAVGTPRVGSTQRTAHTATSVSVASAVKSKTAPAVDSRTGRLSNGLKEFLWQLDGIGRGHLLDLGPARQTTLNFFIERGFKVYTDDLLITWKNFLDADEKQWRDRPAGSTGLEMTPAARAER